MAPAGYNFRETRIVYEEKMTHCYVLLEPLGDCPIGVKGWHYKAFPASTSGEDIFRESVEAVEWPQAAPRGFGQHD